MSILKNEVANKRNKNVDILSLSSQICLKLNGMFFFQQRSLFTFHTIIFYSLYIENDKNVKKKKHNNIKVLVQFSALRTDDDQIHHGT